VADRGSKHDERSVRAMIAEAAFAAGDFSFACSACVSLLEPGSTVGVEVASAVALCEDYRDLRARASLLSTLLMCARGTDVQDLLSAWRKLDFERDLAQWVDADVAHDPAAAITALRRRHESDATQAIATPASSGGDGASAKGEETDEQGHDGAGARTDVEGSDVSSKVSQTDQSTGTTSIHSTAAGVSSPSLIRLTTSSHPFDSAEALSLCLTRPTTARDEAGSSRSGVPHTVNRNAESHESAADSYLKGDGTVSTAAFEPAWAWASLRRALDARADIKPGEWTDSDDCAAYAAVGLALVEPLTALASRVVSRVDSKLAFAYLLALPDAADPGVVLDECTESASSLPLVQLFHRCADHCP
jgi:hypothetical protein